MSGWNPPSRGRPLSGIRVLDFSTLLPGPLATLLLAEAGADVLKVERPGVGDEMRTYVPRLGASSANFALLNRGKRSVVLDLKDEGDRARARSLATGADVVVEQFRPGVMDRLGLGYARLSAAHPGLVYCSITGYGQEGPRAQRAGHDLNYMAEAGLLGLVQDTRGAPALPPVLAADIAGGAYPAVINILMALQGRASSGRGAHLDLAMTGNLATLGYWVQATHAGSGEWPAPGGELLTGASPRYQLYGTADGRFVAAAPLEERFWRRFCELVGLPGDERDDAADPAATIAAVRVRIAARTAADWEAVFAGEDVCCAVVATPEEAAAAHPPDPAHRVTGPGYDVPALPVPLAAGLRPTRSALPYPGLGVDSAVNVQQ
ncbi:MAG TPA: CaiB/BaiF CoA-transferase family protein [Pseudonocardia sp.]|nr:CaiB/BaiF CoA-transferase family protein [Pseudonocardia sp.]